MVSLAGAMPCSFNDSKDSGVNRFFCFDWSSAVSEDVEDLRLGDSSDAENQV